MHPRLRLEIIIERMAANRACNILESAGLSGYTLLPAISGFGGGTRWSRDNDLSASGDMIIILSIGNRATIEAVLEDLNDLLGNHIGVLSITDVQVLRPDRF